MNGQNSLRRPGSTKDCRANDDELNVWVRPNLKTQGGARPTDTF